MRKIIDCHTHAFPDAIATRAIGELASKSGSYIPLTDGTAADLVRVLNSNGVESAFLCNIATKPTQVHSILKWSEQLIADYHGKIIPLSSFHPKSPTCQADLELCLQSELVGFKFHPLYQDFNIDDDIMWQIYDKISRSGKFVLFHAGFDVAYPETFDNASPVRMARVLDKCPDLKVIAAHVGGWHDWQNVYKFLAGRDLYFDVSFLQELPTDLMYNILDKHSQDKLLFGSDTPWTGQKDLIQFIEKLDITEQAKDKIFYKNAKNLLNKE